MSCAFPDLVQWSASEISTLHLSGMPSLSICGTLFFHIHEILGITLILPVCMLRSSISALFRKARQFTSLLHQTFLAENLAKISLGRKLNNSAIKQKTENQNRKIENGIIREVS